MNKEEFFNKYGSIVFEFEYWFKNEFVYISTCKEYKLVICPDYRDCLKRTQTLRDMTICEEYDYFKLYKRGEEIAYFEGDMW